jgi:hypothetical protein
MNMQAYFRLIQIYVSCIFYIDIYLRHEEELNKQDVKPEGKDMRKTYSKAHTFENLFIQKELYLSHVFSKVI